MHMIPRIVTSLCNVDSKSSWSEFYVYFLSVNARISSRESLSFKNHAMDALVCFLTVQLRRFSFPC